MFSHLRTQLLTAAKTQQARPLLHGRGLFSKQLPKRNFSFFNQVKEQIDQSSRVAKKGLALFLFAGSACGLTYIYKQMEQLEQLRPVGAAQGYLSPYVQHRLSMTFRYYAYGLGVTASTVYLLRHSFMWATIHPSIPLLFSAVFMLMAKSGSYEKSFERKLGGMTALSACMGLVILPMLQASTIVNIADACLITALSMGAMAFVAKNAPTEGFITWGPLLSSVYVQLMAMAALSVARPGSMAMTNIYIFGGLAVTSGLTMAHLQAILQKAKFDTEYDPIGNCLAVYLDTIIIFVHILEALGQAAASSGGDG